MQRVVFSLLLALGTVTAWAQTPIPGTFNSAPAQSAMIAAGPILTPPMVSFGNGLTPPVVVNSQAAYVAVPHASEAEPSMVSTRTAASLQGLGSNSAELSGTGTGSAPSNSRFDYVIAPNSGVYSGGEGVAASLGVGDTSLGQVAASLRKGPPPTQRTFTNEDIGRMNGVTNGNYTMPGASTSQPNYPVPQGPGAQAAAPSLPPGAKPSPFSPRIDEPAAQTSQPASPETPTEPVTMAQNTTPQPPGTEARQNGNESTSANQSPNAPSSSAQKKSKRQLPATSSLLPLLVLCGAGITGVGVLLAGRR